MGLREALEEKKEVTDEIHVAREVPEKMAILGC